MKIRVSVECKLNKSGVYLCVTVTMKILAHILTICILSCNSPKRLVDKTNNAFIIKPGKGTNQLKIGKTKITSAFGLLGNNYKREVKYSDGLDTSYITYSYVFANIGLTIVSTSGTDLDKFLITHIYFSRIAKAKTSNGIILNKSSLEEILIAFGKPDEEINYADVTFLHYRKKGISLLIEKAVNKVFEIEVYKKNGYSSHL